jgi:outer membrane protein TolC
MHTHFLPPLRRGASLACPALPVRFRLRGAVFLVALSLVGINTHAEGILAFEQAIALSQARSQQLVAQDHATAAARDMAISAGQQPDPTLKLGINNLPIDGPDRFSVTRDFMTMRSVGVMQEFTREDKRLARSRRFEREAQASEASRALALSQLQRTTAMAWLDRYYQERMLALVKAQRDEVRLQIEAAEVAYRGGRGSQADVFSARAAIVQIDDRIDQTTREVATAKTALARWTGGASDTPLGDAPDTDHIHLHQADLESELAAHPDITVMVKQEEMAQANADVARANKQTDWSVELMLSQRGPGYSNMASFNVSVPLQWDQKNRQDQELAAKLSTVEQMRAQREEATRENLAQVTAMLQSWQSGRDRLSRYDSALIPLAAERTRATLSAYRGGSGTLASVLEARRMELDTRIDRLRLEMETARIWAQLNYLIPAEHDVAAPRP